MIRVFLLVLAASLTSGARPRMGGQSLMGGRASTDPDANPDFKTYAWMGLAQFNARSNAFVHTAPVKVLAVQTQVVAGVNYHLDVLAGHSDCKANQGIDMHAASSLNGSALFRDAPCAHRVGSAYSRCNVTVWSQPWTQRLEVTKSECSRVDDAVATRLAGSRKRLAGGKVPVTLTTKDGAHLRLSINSRAEAEAWQGFQIFLQAYDKAYTGGKREYLKRFRIFHRNMKLLRHMREMEKGSAVYGVTAYSDLSPREFRTKVLIPAWREPDFEMPLAKPADVHNAPDNWDWRQHGAVTPVKNQGSCGSCWAFSVTGNIEGQWAIKKGKLISLSEQQLVDCDKLDQGCNGGLPSNAYKEVERFGGLEKEGDYPYDARGESCSFNKSEVAVRIDSSVKVSQDEGEMKTWLYKNGPISIGIDAMAMQFYWHGIAHPWKIFCNPNTLNHGVLIVGYGVSADAKAEPFWIVKNSWGPHWGEAGYYRIYRGKGVCGLNKMATSAIVN